MGPSTVKPGRDPDSGMKFGIPVCALLVCGAAVVSAQTDLRIGELEEELRIAEIAVSSSSLWTRIMPSIHLSGSIGLKGALFYDPEVGVLFPADSYRLTVSVPLHGLLTGWKHEEALARRRRVQVELERARRAAASEKEGVRNRLAALEAELSVLRAERDLLEHIVRYHQLLFDQGAVKFDVVARSKLQVLGAERMILDRISQTNELRRTYDLD
jgi:outer membrane protein TolC